MFVLMKIKRGMDLTDMNGGLREISLSLRERARVRGIKLLKNRTFVRYPSLLSFSRREKVRSFELVGQQWLINIHQRFLLLIRIALRLCASMRKDF
jgi:hypothetical protein